MAREDRAIEIELKLLVEPRDHARLKRSPLLAAASPARQDLETIYFDTPQLELAARDLALRLRRAGGRWVEGLKSAQRGSGGLHARDEWEYERLDPAIDLSRFARTPLAHVPDAATLHRRLVPLFRVAMTRTSWRLSPREGSLLEVALDDGRVESEGRSEAVSELEIECLEGDTAAAFDLAEALLRSFTLRPSPVSKAQRGYRLFVAAPPRPVKATRIDLDPRASIAEASRRVVGAALRQLHANEEGVLASTDPEFVHQARIALRRMRAALRMFRAGIGAQRAALWRRRLRQTARELGVARDWDVFATQTLPPVLAGFGDVDFARGLRERVAAMRAASRAQARKALRRRAYARTLIEITRWLAQPPPRQEGDAETLRDFAARLLRKRHKRVTRDEPRLEALTPAERHALRIACKRLRYGTDALASLFPRARVDAYLATLSGLQDALGEANDAQTALDLMAEVRLPRRFAAFARTRFALTAASDAARLREMLRRLHDHRPWRHP